MPKAYRPAPVPRVLAASAKIVSHGAKQDVKGLATRRDQLGRLFVAFRQAEHQPENARLILGKTCIGQPKGRLVGTGTGEKVN